MPDIQMCTGEGCQKKDSCWRHTAKPDKCYQSWFDKPPFLENGDCEYFWRRVSGLVKTEEKNEKD